MINVASPVTKARLARWAASHPRIRCLIVFGSYAKGTANEESDLDIAVVVRLPAEASEKLLQWMDDKPKWLNELRDLLTFRDIQLEELSPEDPHVTKYVREAHIVMYDPEGVLAKFL